MSFRALGKVVMRPRKAPCDRGVVIHVSPYPIGNKAICGQLRTRGHVMVGVVDYATCTDCGGYSLEERAKWPSIWAMPSSSPRCTPAEGLAPVTHPRA